ILAVLIDAIEYASNFPVAWDAKTNKSNKIEHCLELSNDLLPVANEYMSVASSKTFVRSLQDMPSNMMNPAKFESKIKQRFQNLKNVQIEVLDSKILKEKEMNLILAVGQGCTQSEESSRIVVIKYLNNPNDKNINCFIGKGICFDTGGLNIKTGNYMRWMKYDMSGSAIVAGLAESLAKNNIKTNFIAICALATNLCGSNSYRPDDVIIGYNKMSVEIDNTDAEGRLVMADAIAYAVKDLNATRIFDIATLTGAMIYALGDTYTGVWTNDEIMWNNLEVASKKSGELVWRLPFHHDFKDLLKSQFADICNSVSDPRGGSSRAAMFLKQFTNDLPYMHFDVAATADKGNVGTGIMLHTMYNFFKNNQ
ncbi:MAG: leucyl aminopeptidase, partial [Ureaplasma sp.]|nr:leucyl aminopeptidase [Ureaplasma sp.]